MKAIFFIFFILFSLGAFSSENTYKVMPKHDWSFDGITGIFDKAAIQRGYKVYREVCSGCHSMKLLYFRDLIDIGFSEAQVKVIASDYTVLDGPNNEGEMFERSARPADKFANPYTNDNEARVNNNGVYPPDLSVITKARKHGVDYIYNLLLGYIEPPKDVNLGQGMYYNEWMPGNQIAMPSPLSDGVVDYDDGTDNNIEQLSEDVVYFLKWAAEPEMEIRKNLGIKVILFFIILGFVVYLGKNRLWRDVR